MVVFDNDNRNQIDDVHVDSISVQIKAGSVYKYPIVLPRDNAQLSWNFTSKYYDVEFSVIKSEETGVYTQIIPPLLYSREDEHTGEIIAVNSGIYYLVWDNSSSWLRDRYIEFSISVHFPEFSTDEKNMCSKYDSITVFTIGIFYRILQTCKLHYRTLISRLKKRRLNMAL